mmetsp:Transcript_6814/g.24221  ORF Transcript_6814/g.24221 Transcript_6814/m.24221 type:complete len:336 (-) Transcript_6814:307-1314(-)
MPGSRPLSMSTVTPAARASSSSAAISSLVYDAVTTCFLCTSAARMTGGCMKAGTRLTTMSCWKTAEESLSGSAMTLSAIGCTRGLPCASVSASAKMNDATVMQLLGRRSRYSTSGGVTMPAPSSRMRLGGSVGTRGMANLLSSPLSPDTLRPMPLVAAAPRSFFMMPSSCLGVGANSCSTQVVGVWRSLPTLNSRMRAEAALSSTMSSALLMKPLSKRWPAKRTDRKLSLRERFIATRFESARSLAWRSSAMYLKSGVSAPWSVMVAWRSSTGMSSCSSYGLLPSDRASAGRKGVSFSEKCMLASAGHSEGRWSTAWKSSPGAPISSDVVPVATS